MAYNINTVEIYDAEILAGFTSGSSETLILHHLVKYIAANDENIYNTFLSAAVGGSNSASWSFPLSLTYEYQPPEASESYVITVGLSPDILLEFLPRIRGTTLKGETSEQGNPFSTYTLEFLSTTPEGYEILFIWKEEEILVEEDIPAEEEESEGV